MTSMNQIASRWRFTDVRAQKPGSRTTPRSAPTDAITTLSEWKALPVKKSFPNSMAQAITIVKSHAKPAVSRREDRRRLIKKR